MEYQAKVEFRDYLPHPLRNMAELTPRRQLVAEINSSSLYLTDFPVLAKDPNFVENWKRFTELVAANINLVELELQAEFLSQWNQFVVAIESDTSRFTDSALATIPRTLLAEWKNFDFRFLQRLMTYQEQLFLQYLESILSPSSENLWVDFADTIEGVLDDYVHPHINTLSKIREITSNTDAQVVNLTARMLGLNFRDELLDAFGKDRVAAIIPMLGEAYEVASTDDFIKLVELTIGAELLMEHLYTNDYINFKSYDEMVRRKGKILQEGGSSLDWFKTTHVNLFVEYSNSRYLAAKINATLGTTLLEIVEHFLPANLVLKTFGLKLAINTPENAAGLYFSAEHGLRRGHMYVGQSQRPAPKPKNEPTFTTAPTLTKVSALVFANKTEVDDYIARFVEPTPEEIFSSWGRYAGNKWYPGGVIPQGEATAWIFVANENRIECTLNTAAPVGFVSTTTTQRFELEATLVSTDKDDDLIGLTAAFAVGNDGIIRAVHFVRNNYTTANWCVYIQEGDKLTRVLDKSNSSTQGFMNPTKKGWFESKQTRIRIERNGNIIKGYTSAFGSDVLLPNTEMVFDLAANSKTRSLVGQQRYGYFAHSQSKASFKDQVISGEFESNNLYDLETNSRYHYDINTKTWLVQTGYVFADNVTTPSVVENPVTMVEYYIDNTKQLKRLTSYV